MLQPKIPEIDESIWRPHLANFAPLPEAFIAHIFQHPHAIRLPSYGNLEPPSLFEQIWWQIQVARETVSYRLAPTLAAQQITGQKRMVPDWFKRNFEVYASRSSPLPKTTVQEWINKKLLLLQNDVLEPNSVISVYMMRYLFRQDQRRWMPKRRRIDAPWFYVWGLLPEEKIPRIYPFPFPPDLPPRLMLYTQYIGVHGCNGWHGVQGVGSLAWGRTREFAGRWYWDITEDDMALWDAGFVRDYNVRRRDEMLGPIREGQTQGLPDADQRYIVTRIHNNATLLLENIGEPILAGYMAHNFGYGKLPTKPFIPF